MWTAFERVKKVFTNECKAEAERKVDELLNEPDAAAPSLDHFYGSAAPPPRKRQRGEAADTDGSKNKSNANRNVGGGGRFNFGLTPRGAKGRDSMYAPALPGRDPPPRHQQRQQATANDSSNRNLPPTSATAGLRRDRTVRFDGGNSAAEDTTTGGMRARGSFGSVSMDGSLLNNNNGGGRRLPPRSGRLSGQQSIHTTGFGTGAHHVGIGFNPTAQPPESVVSASLQQRYNYQQRAAASARFSGAGSALAGGSKAADDYVFGSPSVSLEKIKGGGSLQGSMGTLSARGGAANLVSCSPWELPLPNHNPKPTLQVNGAPPLTNSNIHPSRRGRPIGFGGDRSPRSSRSPQHSGGGLSPQDSSSALPGSRVVGKKANRFTNSEDDASENGTLPPPAVRTETLAGGEKDADQVTLRASVTPVPDFGPTPASFTPKHIPETAKLPKAFPGFPSTTPPPEGDTLMGGISDAVADGAALGKKQQSSTTTFALSHESPQSRKKNDSTWILEDNDDEEAGGAGAAFVKRSGDLVGLGSYESKKKSIPRANQQQAAGFNKPEQSGRLYHPNDYAVYGEGRTADDAQELQEKLFEARINDLIMEELTERILQDGVRSKVRDEVKKQTDSVFGAMYGLFKAQVKLAASKICPRATGVLKCAQRGQPCSLPVDFDDEDRAMLSKIHQGNSEELIVTAGGSVEIYKRHLKTLEGKEWLADPVINGYCKLVEDRFATDENKVCCMTSFFYEKLKKAGYSGTSRFTRKIDMFSYKKILVVINKSSHWTLAVINFKRKRLEYFDSLGGRGDDVLATLRDYLDQEYVARKLNGQPDSCRYTHDWTLYQPGKIGVPQQDNGYDCGVFTTQFALYSAQDAGHFEFGQSNIKYLRQMIQLELLGKKLLKRL